MLTTFLCFTAKEEVITISKKVRIRLTQFSPCTYKDIKDQILTKLQKKLLSQEVCNFPCKIFKLQLRCPVRRGERVVSISFEIQMDQNVISTSKFCNDTCMKCQMEERLQKMISGIRTLTDNNKLNVSVYGQTFTVTKKSLRVITKESDNCYKEKVKRKAKRLGEKYHDIKHCEVDHVYNYSVFAFAKLARTSCFTVR